MSEGEEIIQRCKTLGVVLPTSMAFLPQNLLLAVTIDEFGFSKLTPDLERVLANEGQQVEFAVDRESRAYVEERGADWLLPVLIFGMSVDGSSIQIALNIISSYLYDRMRRMKTSANAKMTLVRRNNGAYERLSYDGPVEGLKVLKAWRLEGGDGTRDEND